MGNGAVAWRVVQCRTIIDLGYHKAKPSRFSAMIARELSALSTQSLIYSLGHDYCTRAHNWPTYTLPLGTMAGDGDDAAPAGIRALRAFAKAPPHMVRASDTHA